MTLPRTLLMNDAALQEARRWLGTPYRHQASCRGAGTDCLGLVRGIYRVLYGQEPETIPPYTPAWAEVSGEETLHDAALRHLEPAPLDDLRAGDVLLFRMMPHSPIKHAGILAGTGTSGDTMIHAYSGRAVCETHLGRWWHTRLAVACRWPSRIPARLPA